MMNKSVVCRSVPEDDGVQAVSYLSTYIADQASIGQPVSKRDEAIVRGLMARVDLARDRLPCSDLAASWIVADLACRGLKLAGTEEQGWSYQLPHGVVAWVSDLVAA